MKFLLTSGGISNDRIRHALVESLGKPIAESSALYIPTALHANLNGPDMIVRLLRGEFNTSLCPRDAQRDEAGTNVPAGSSALPQVLFFSAVARPPGTRGASPHRDEEKKEDGDKEQQGDDGADQSEDATGQ
ncbi:MAG TPA: hypothetical protein VIZ18_19105 [Ktedonobacteraceae bacterium]